MTPLTLIVRKQNSQTLNLDDNANYENKYEGSYERNGTRTTSNGFTIFTGDGNKRGSYGI